MCKYEDFRYINNFESLNFNQFSDHAPLQFNIACNISGQVDATYINKKSIKWESTQRDSFRRSLIAKLPDFNAMFHNRQFTSDTEVENLVSDFTSILNEVAKPLFCKERIVNTSKAHFIGKSSIKPED